MGKAKKNETGEAGDERNRSTNIEGLRRRRGHREALLTYAGHVSSSSCILLVGLPYSSTTPAPSAAATAMLRRTTSPAMLRRRASPAGRPPRAGAGRSFRARSSDGSPPSRRARLPAAAYGAVDAPSNATRITSSRAETARATRGGRHGEDRASAARGGGGRLRRRSGFVRAMFEVAGCVRLVVVVVVRRRPSSVLTERYCITMGKSSSSAARAVPIFVCLASFPGHISLAGLSEQLNLAS